MRNNNILIWLTGWGFGTFNTFHRWIARVATVQAILHSIGYTVLVLDSESITFSIVQYTNPYCRWWLGQFQDILAATLVVDGRNCMELTTLVFLESDY
jgi:hypothetical protein